MLRWLTAGESHGPALVAILEGMPAHVRITTDDVSAALARRRLGKGRGARMSFEQDQVTILGGVRHGETMGGPVAIEIANTEWPKWEQVMSADPVDPVILEGLARNAPLTRPRPGHADLVGMQKYASTRPGPCSSAPPPGRPRPGSPWGPWRRPSWNGRRTSAWWRTSWSWAGCGHPPARSRAWTTSPTRTPTRCAAWIRRPARRCR